MLEKIGGECAGALSFLPTGERPHPDKNNYYEFGDMQLTHLLQELPARPLLAGKEGVRLSLAGVQDKLAVRVDNGKISIPLDSSPSTHILKPDFGVYKGVIFNEALCLALAKKVGLSVATATLNKTGDIDYLLVKRYDRIIDNDDIVRIHQEDFCQALGISSKKKYQREGGPSIKQCVDLLRRVSTAPVIDLDKLVNAVIFNYLIGNCDAHGKNFSLLYNNALQFAPLYDLVCTLYYGNLDQKMAMKVGGEYLITRIRAEHFDALATDIGFSKAEMRRRITELIEATLAALPTLDIQHSVQKEVVGLIKARCERAFSLSSNKFPKI
jgi:serine/threonine-protein kinase HipA